MRAFCLSPTDCRASLPHCRCVVRISLVMPNTVEDCGAHRYQSQWQAYRERRTWFGVLICCEFLAVLPFAALVSSGEKRLFSTDKMFVPAFLVWGALCVFTGFRLRRFPCPRCGKNFFFGLFDRPRNVSGQACANCGLRKYAEE